MYCKYCGSQIDNDSVFCSHCGKQITEVEPIENSQEYVQSQGVVKDDKQNQNKEKVIPPNIHQFEEKEIKHKKERSKSGKSYASFYIKYIGLALLTILVIVIYFSVIRKKSIADISIDKVSIELAEASQKYDELGNFHEGLALVKENDKFGYIDKLGNEIISCQYDDAEDFKCGMALVKNGDKMGAINNQNEFVIPCIYNDLYIFNDSTVRAEINGEEGVINNNGKTIVPFEYDGIWEPSEGLFPVRKNGSIGFINKSGKLVIPLQYEEINDIGFCQGLAGVKIDGKWGYIDKKGEIAIPFDEHLTGCPFYSGLSTIKRGGNKCEMDAEGRIKVKNNQPFEMAVINKEGLQVSKWFKGNIMDFENGFACIRGEKFSPMGMIDSNLNVVIPIEFRTMNKYETLGDNLFWVTLGEGKDGFYDIKNNCLAIPCIYDIPLLGVANEEGLVAAVKSGKCGFLNSNNEAVIPFIYDRAEHFSEGFAVVVRNGKYGYVDRYGNDTFSVKIKAQ